MLEIGFRESELLVGFGPAASTRVLSDNHSCAPQRYLTPGNSALLRWARIGLGGAEKYCDH
jgi:hypothetical protein